MSSALPQTLIDLVASRLLSHLSQRLAGHCVRVDDLTVADAHAFADEIVRHDADCDVHILAREKALHRFDIEVDRAIELRNRKRRPLMLLVPAGAGHAASSLVNSFEPLPLIGLLADAARTLEQQLAATVVAEYVAEVRRVLGRTRHGGHLSGRARAFPQRCR